jgi:hypothetical protein
MNTTGRTNPEPDERRFFVKVTGSGARAFARLRSLDLDLFVPTLKKDREGGVSIEGLLTLREVEQLVDFGFSVTVEEPDTKRSRPHEVIDFEEWLRGMEEDLGPIRKE